jgi:hypothetical protein
MKATEEQKQQMRDYYSKNRQRILMDRKEEYKTDPRNRIFHPEKARLAKLGEKNPNWKDEDILDQSARRRAEKLFIVPEGFERHHIDGNPKNNDPTNIKIVRRKEHMVSDGRLEKLIKRNKGEI